MSCISPQLSIQLDAWNFLKISDIYNEHQTTLLIQREPNTKPILLTITDEEEDQMKMISLISTHGIHYIPKLYDDNFYPLCYNKSKDKRCLIFISNSIESIHELILPLLPIEQLQLGWIHSEQQNKFIKFLYEALKRTDINLHNNVQKQKVKIISLIASKSQVGLKFIFL
jgi:hypothetical protein